MAYKKKLTLIDVLLYLRELSMSARENKDMEMVWRLIRVSNLIQDCSYRRGDTKIAGLMDEITAYLGDTSSGDEWKSVMPPIDTFLSLETSSAQSTKVKATIIRRLVLRDNLRPLPIFIVRGENMPSEQVDPDWIAIVHCEGPYQDTYDLLYYKQSGTLQSFQEFETLELALSYSTEKLGIDEEWEECQVDITDADEGVSANDSSPTSRA